MFYLEDIDVAGFPVRKPFVNDAVIKACLSWIANFHAFFLNVDPEVLWPIVTYRHLETRPEELEAMSDQTELRKFLDEKASFPKLKLEWQVCSLSLGLTFIAFLLDGCQVITRLLSIAKDLLRRF